MGARLLFLAAGLAILIGCRPAPKPAETATPPPADESPAEATTPGVPPIGVPATVPATPKKTGFFSRPEAPKATPVPKVPVSTQPPPAVLWKEFSGERARRTAKELVELGPRPAGSMELGRARGLLTSALRQLAWEVESQPFQAATPHGEIEGTNLIARFSADGSRPVPKTARKVVLAAHYDTRFFSTIRFVGANEGASGPAVLLEAARVLALDPALAAKIEIVFFDASEPRGQFTSEDGLAGSRHYAKSAAPNRAVILHGVGDQASAFSLAPDTAPEVFQDLRAAHTAVASPLHFQNSPVRLWSDHLSFGPAALLIGQHGAMVRYTADDTLERISPATLGHTGELVIWLAKRWANE